MFSIKVKLTRGINHNHIQLGMQFKWNEVYLTQLSGLPLLGIEELVFPTYLTQCRGMLEYTFLSDTSDKVHRA